MSMHHCKFYVIVLNFVQYHIKIHFYPLFYIINIFSACLTLFLPSFNHSLQNNNDSYLPINLIILFFTRRLFFVLFNLFPVYMYVRKCYVIISCNLFCILQLAWPLLIYLWLISYWIIGMKFHLLLVSPRYLDVGFLFVSHKSNISFDIHGWFFFLYFPVVLAATLVNIFTIFVHVVVVSYCVILRVASFILPRTRSW